MVNIKFRLSMCYIHLFELQKFYANQNGKPNELAEAEELYQFLNNQLKEQHILDQSKLRELEALLKQLNQVFLEPMTHRKE